MNKSKIINRAKKTLSTEVKELQNLSKIFNNNFYKAVILLSKVKGRVIVTGVGKSAHIGNKISATLASTGTPSYLIHATEASHGDLGGITKNDCILAISNSGETSELNNIISKAIEPKSGAIATNGSGLIKFNTGPTSKPNIIIGITSGIPVFLNSLSPKNPIATAILILPNRRVIVSPSNITYYNTSHLL